MCVRVCQYVCVCVRLCACVYACLRVPVHVCVLSCYQLLGPRTAYLNLQAYIHIYVFLGNFQQGPLFAAHVFTLLCACASWM